MAAPVVAIGLDAADPLLVEHWISQGSLPQLARLQSQGAYGRLFGRSTFRAETAWTTFLTGCDPERTGYWTGLRFDPASYSVTDTGAYDYKRQPPFYALGAGHRVAIVDVPQTTIVDSVNGLQLIAWGAHSPMHASCSKPEGLLAELNGKYGPHPALNRDHATFWNPVAVAWLRRVLQTGIRRRVEICRDLMAREPWDLFLTAFGETHTAGHYFWHFGNPNHPLSESQRSRLASAKSTPILETFQQVDAAVGELASLVPADSYLVVYSIHGMESNSMDLPSMVFLPELLHRLSFGGKSALAETSPAGKLPPVATAPRSLSWQRDTWSRGQANSALLRAARRVLPIELTHALERIFGVEAALDYPSEAGDLWYQPAMWYRSKWPRMRAFALPSFSEGYVRVNLRGRERDGVVAPADYSAVCDEITREILALRNSRTGKRLAERVIRTRNAAGDGDDPTPDADLIVQWNAEPADVVESERAGRIGPVAYGRTGSHVSRGLVLVRGPGIAAGTTLDNADTKDLAPTLLSLCGATPKADLQGTPLQFRRTHSSV